MDAAKVATGTLNFSWLIDEQVAGCAAPMSKAELAYLSRQGIRAIVRLAHPDKDDFVIDSADVEAAGLEDLQIPVQDFHAPSRQQIEEGLSFVQEQLQAGKPVAVSCGAGYGRTGTVLACYLVSGGMSATEAIHKVRERRPDSIETEEQEQAVQEFQRVLRNG